MYYQCILQPEVGGGGREGKTDIYLTAFLHKLENELLNLFHLKMQAGWESSYLDNVISLSDQYGVPVFVNINCNLSVPDPINCQIKYFLVNNSG